MRFDVVIVGGGHAGIEAANACAKMGVKTCMVTLSRETIGRMSCNPSIGGVGKGQLVKEIDALGGVMGIAADKTGIQFRMLNTKKGPAVWSPRAQCDKFKYNEFMSEYISNLEGLTLIEDEVEEIITDGHMVTGVCLNKNGVVKCAALVVTTGTFMRGMMHCGEQKEKGGRIGEGATSAISETLAGLGLKLGRLKTGTPPRLHKDSIDYDKVEVQEGDYDFRPFSFSTGKKLSNMIVCWQTWTNQKTCEIVRENIHRAPMYTGQISSKGPRYCPSFEDKVVRFKDKDSHLIFLEPEGIDSDSIYCNGISTSTPPDVQERFVRSIRGLENAKFLRYGYAVEYDFIYPHQLRPTLESKNIEGLFTAGQVNGTSGYEEAAAQGLMAGINAALRIKGGGEFTLGRDKAYIGVMLDDLTSKSELYEPYRMFTSLVEYRLLLRQDNAYRRLIPYAAGLGMVDKEELLKLKEFEQQIHSLRLLLEKEIKDEIPLSQWLRRPEVTINSLISSGTNEISKYRDMPKVLEQVEIEVKYEGYIKRNLNNIKKLGMHEATRIPESIDYYSVPYLRYEVKEKLSQIRPYTLGQAMRITGVSMADINIVLMYMKQQNNLLKAG